MMSFTEERQIEVASSNNTNDEEPRKPIIPSEEPKKTENN